MKVLNGSDHDLGGPQEYRKIRLTRLGYLYKEHTKSGKWDTTICIVHKN